MRTIMAVPGANCERAFTTDVKSGHDVGCAWVNIAGLIKAKATCVKSETRGFSGTASCCLDAIQSGRLYSKIQDNTTNPVRYMIYRELDI